MFAYFNYLAPKYTLKKQNTLLKGIVSITRIQVLIICQRHLQIWNLPSL